MRIISGSLRGRHLKGPRGLELRPTSDRLKETLFDILGPGIAGTAVLDVFAGTGAIGLEALSRGARQAVFIELDRKASLLIRENIELCRISGGYRILEGDVFTLLRTLAHEGFAADFIFLDPPYRWGPYLDLLKTLFGLRIAGSGALVVVEHHRKTPLPEAGDGFRLVRSVRQGDTCLSFYRSEPPPDSL